MAKIVWDKTGERKYETGTDRGVVYVKAQLALILKVKAGMA